MNELGRLLKNARMAKGLTQADVERRAKVARSTVSQLERGKRDGSRSDSRDLLIRIAKVLDLDSVRVLELAGHLERSDIKTIRTRPTLEEFILTEPTLTNDQRATLVSLVRMVQERSG